MIPCSASHIPISRLHRNYTDICDICIPLSLLRGGYSLQAHFSRSFSLTIPFTIVFFNVCRVGTHCTFLHLYKHYYYVLCSTIALYVFLLFFILCFVHLYKYFISVYFKTKMEGIIKNIFYTFIYIY